MNRKQLLAAAVVLCVIAAVGLYLALRGGRAGGPHMPGKTAKAGRETVTVDLGGGVKMEFVSIPAGRFMMGAAPGEDGAYADESPRHEVNLTKEIWMGKYEVTQAQWQRVMSNNPSFYSEAGASAPVENVSWADCATFFEKLNAMMASKAGGAAATGFRLPTEAEWEYACRAGTTTRFAHGDDEWAVADAAWYQGNSEGKTHPTGQKKPNAWGLYDMQGNVWEWCSDWYGAYSEDPVTNPTGRHYAASRILRGGAWSSLAISTRSARRFFSLPNVTSNDFGLRGVWERLEPGRSPGQEAARPAQSSAPRG